MGEQVGVGEFGRVISDIDLKLARIDSNQAEALSYTMQNEQRITENEYKTQSVADDVKITVDRIDSYDKLFVKAAIAIVLTFGGTGAGIYALIDNNNPPNNTAKTTQIANQ